MPADPRVDDRRARTLDGLRELHGFAPVAAVRNQVEHRQPVDRLRVVADAAGRDDLIALRIARSSHHHDAGRKQQYKTDDKASHQTGIF